MLSAMVRACGKPHAWLNVLDSTHKMRMHMHALCAHSEREKERAMVSCLHQGHCISVSVCLPCAPSAPDIESDTQSKFCTTQASTEHTDKTYRGSELERMCLTYSIYNLIVVRCALFAKCTSVVCCNTIFRLSILPKPSNPMHLS